LQPGIRVHSFESLLPVTLHKSMFRLYQIYAKDSTQGEHYSHISIMLESGSESEKYIDIY